MRPGCPRRHRPGAHDATRLAAHDATVSPGCPRRHVWLPTTPLVWLPTTPRHVWLPTTPRLAAHDATVSRLAAHDATAFYQMAHDRWRTQVFIPLNTTNEGNYQQITMEKISQQGIPICREGHDMYFSGYCKDLDRVKWRCPIKATKAGKSLGCECLCSRSTYGRVVYTHPKDNLRLYPKTPRNSLTWKAYYNHLYLCPARFQTPKTGFQAHTVQDEIERPPSLLCAALGYGCPC